MVDIDVFEVSRTITYLRFTSLAHALGSCAVVLDWYKPTYPRWHTQKEWSEIRGVNRQTVNDRNREARRMHEEWGVGTVCDPAQLGTYSIWGEQWYRGPVGRAVLNDEPTISSDLPI